MSSKELKAWRDMLEPIPDWEHLPNYCLQCPTKEACKKCRIFLKVTEKEEHKAIREFKRTSKFLSKTLKRNFHYNAIESLADFREKALYYLQKEIERLALQKTTRR